MRDTIATVASLHPSLRTILENHVLRGVNSGQLVIGLGEEARILKEVKSLAAQKIKFTLKHRDEYADERESEPTVCYTYSIRPH